MFFIQRLLREGRLPSPKKDETSLNLTRFTSEAPQLLRFNFDGEAVLSSIRSVRETIQFSGSTSLCVLLENRTGLVEGEVVAVVERDGYQLALLTATFYGPTPFGRALKEALTYAIQAG